jgi:Tol biopolymer transport system component/tetratricopeptide (TPR) repeat protein
MRLESLCRNRGGTSESLRRELAGDLDNIILKAMAKEPQRRYHSVEHLCEDITRHLEGSPIHAPSYFTAAIRSSKSSNPLSAEPTAGDKTFAVLPFRTLSALTADETDGEYLGLGLADALITRLSKIQRIAVRPTSSVARYSNPTFDPFTAGYELGVNFVLDGRIQRVAERIRVTVQLLNVRDGAAVWAEQFDENFTDVLTLQDIISAEVAEALVPQLTSDERLQLAKRGTDSAEAFEAYLRGRYYWNTFTEEGFARAITQFYRAVALDPSYAAAHTGIADYYNWLGIYGVLPPAECFAAAKEAALKAIELDSTLAEAYTALGFATACYDFDWATAEAHYRRAIELNPNYATARQWYCFHLLMIGHFNEAIAEIRQALEIDPLSSSFRQALGWSYYQARRYDESIIEHRKLIAMDSGFALGRFSFTWPLLQKGMREQAIAEARKAVELSGGSPFMLAGLGSAYARAGKKDKAHAVLRELNELSAKRYVSPYHVAIIHCNLGDTEQALALLEQTYVNRDAWLIWLSVEPQLDPLRADPRFVDLLQRVYPPNEDETKIAVANANREARADSNTRDEHIPAMRDTEIDRRGRLLPTSRWSLIASVAMIACLLAVIFFYFRSSNGTINLVRSGEPVRLTNNLSFNIQPDWSPDGNQIVFASNREGHYQIYVMNADGANTTRLTYNLTDDSMPAWSPDGRRIAFTSKRAGDDEVYVMNADGSNQTNLSHNRAADSRPAWSPDGKRIAFVSNRDAERNAYDIYVMDADGKDQTRLTNDSHLNSDPAWSPDGQKIAFVSNRTGNFEIYTMGADGSNPKNITNNPAFDGKPAWSPDGARIAFTSNRSNGNFNIYVINADGSNARNVTANTVIDDEPAWSPDGSKIVYQSEYNGNFEIYTINVAAALRVKALANNTTRAPSIAVLPFTTNAR